MHPTDLFSKKIAIIGYGREGASVCKYLIQHGARPVVLDRKPEIELLPLVGDDVEIRAGDEYLDDLEAYEVVIRSPGVPRTSPALVLAAKAGVQVTSATQIFFDLAPCPIIGVTGTKGKGTTSTLICEMLRESGLGAQLGGNIGKPAIDLLDTLRPESLAVLELSSFQLQGLGKSPHVSVVLSITADHLDLHKNRDEYVEAKSQIVRSQSQNDYAIINADDATAASFAEFSRGKILRFSVNKTVTPGGWISGDELYAQIEQEPVLVGRGEEIKLKGLHNLSNILAASLAALACGATLPAVRKIAATFSGLPCRLEDIGEAKDRRFVNDSMATMPEATIAALRALSQPIVLIVGGYDKHADYADLGKEIAGNPRVRGVVVIGQTGKKILDSLENAGYKKTVTQAGGDMPTIIASALAISKPDDTILLSPASASFDMFRDAYDRGEQFNKAVTELSNDQ